MYTLRLLKKVWIGRLDEPSNKRNQILNTNREIRRAFLQKESNSKGLRWMLEIRISNTSLIFAACRSHPSWWHIVNQISYDSELRAKCRVDILLTAYRRLGCGCTNMRKIMFSPRQNDDNEMYLYNFVFRVATWWKLMLNRLFGHVQPELKTKKRIIFCEAFYHRIKGGMTHFASTTDLKYISSAGGFWHLYVYCDFVKNPGHTSLEIRSKLKCNVESLLFYLLTYSFISTLLEYKYWIKMSMCYESNYLIFL